LGIFAVLAAIALLAIVIFSRFLRNEPVVYEDSREHFKYGSIGSETSSGLPYWVWKVLPEMFPEKLPGKGGYASFGFLYEDGRDLPIGVSRRYSEGLDRVWLNCSACHTGTVRDAPNAPRKTYVGMPANNFKLYEFIQFLRAVSLDNRLNPDLVMEKIEAMGGRLDWLDRILYRYIVIDRVRSSLFGLRHQLEFMDRQHQWGPGRVDTFNPYKAIQFNFPMDKLPREELIGPADYPSIWNQGPRQGMNLHWDGNNPSVEERNKSAALGAGVTPVTIDMKAIGRIENWIWDLKPPPYTKPVNAKMSASGQRLYEEYCAACHGKHEGSKYNFDTHKFPYLGQVDPIDHIRTDTGRLNSYTELLSVNQNTLYAGYSGRFKGFHKTNGYANMPLDGIWLRSPYLHNGSVPTLRDLLNPASQRPKVFYRGYDVFDWDKVGFVADVAEEKGQQFFRYDTSVEGNSNVGHEGEVYGTDLSDVEKNAIVEYMKTF
jgi:mono/diheme cytochrome c family protein